jgi:hypothetical protein
MAVTALETARTEDGLILDSPEAILDALSMQERPDVEKLLFNLSLLINQAETNEETTKRRIDDLTIRRQRYGSQKVRYRRVLIDIMHELGLPAFHDAELDLSLRDGGEKVFITEAREIPERYHRSETTISYDKLAIRNAIKAGVEVPGAVLGQGDPVLTIRTK